jgi:RND family efflux transporter MFP subunit
MASNPSFRLCWLAPLLAGLVAGCKPTATPASRDAAKAPTPVTTLVVELRPMERTIPAFGTLQAMDHATVSIKTTGRLKLLKVDVGSPVKAGEVLAQIEPRDYELRVQQSAALLAQARARLGLPIEGEDDSVDLEKVSIVREAKALFDEAEKTLERVRRLQSEKISSEAELERAQAEQQVTLNRYRDALQDARERQAILAQRRAEFEIAKQQLTDTSLRAPFDGVVQARLTNVGEFLTSGSPVLSLVQVDPLRLRLEVPERQAMQIQPAQTVRMTFEGRTNYYLGQISRVSPALDERKRMLLVEAEFKNPGTLRPGAFARAEIVTEPAVPTLAIPTDALVTFAGTEKAFLVQTNRAVERRLTIGRRSGGWVEVLQGVRPGDVVIRKPGGLQSGDPVQAVPGRLTATMPDSPSGTN